MFTKIIASIGPASASAEIISNMIKEGTCGFRINFAHGSPEVWEKYIDIVRTAESKLNKPLALIGDLEGASLRLGKIETPIVLKKGEVARIVPGALQSGGEKTIPMPVEKFFEIIDTGDVLVMDDGRVRLRVIDVSRDYVEVIAVTDATITSRKAVVIQGKEVDLPAISERDLENIKFALGQNFDYIALSNIRSAGDIENLRGILRRYEREDVGIIAKIENKSAVRNLEEIIDASDVVLIARGDLGMNFGLEEVHYLQKHIVDVCLEKKKPVIIATQLLESMIEKPAPTRAEVIDVSVAVEMGVDALMLTGETAVGKYPVEAVTWLNRVILFTERNILPRIQESIARKARRNITTLQYRFALGVLELAENLNSKLLVFSIHGNTARRLSILKPKIPVFIGSPDLRVLRKLTILWGIQPIHVEANTYDEGLQRLLDKARELGIVRYGDIAVLSYGLREPRQKIEILHIM